MIAVMRFVPDTAPADPGPLDWRGLLCSTVGLAALMTVTESAGESSFPSWLRAGLIAVSFSAIAAYVVHARSVERPILELRLLLYPSYRASLLGGILLRVGLGATPLLLPLLFQVGLGWTPLLTGWVMLASGLGALACKPAAPALVRRFGYRPVLRVSNAATAFLTALPAAFRTGTPIAVIAAALFVSGLVRSLQFTALSAVAYADLPKERVAQASTLAVVTQQMALSLGISFGGLLLNATRSVNDASIPPERFVLPLIAVAAVSALAGPLYQRLPKSVGADVGGGGSRSSAPA